MTRLTSKLIVIAVALYSIVHFSHTVAHTRCIGDFIGAFPGPFVARYNPQLCENIWSIYGLVQFERVKSAPADLLSEGMELNDLKRLGVVVLQGQYYLLSRWQYGPILHFITLPLTLLPNIQRVCVAWTVANLLFLAIAALLIYRMAAPTNTKGIFTIVYLALWSNFYPLLEAVRQGNIELFELMLVVLACWWFKRHAIRSGFLLGVAAMTKFLPLIFLPYCALKKSWKALIVSLATVLMITWLTELSLGWKNSLLLKELSHQDSFVWGQHQTLSAIIGRCFGEFTTGWLGADVPVMTEEQTALAYRWYQVGCGVSLIVGLWIFLKTRATLIADFSLVVSVMIFFPIHNHPYYQIFLLLPFSFLLGTLWRVPSIPKGILLAVCYLATMSLVVPLSVVDTVLSVPIGSTVRLMQNLSVPAWANLILILWLIAERNGDTAEAVLAGQRGGELRRGR